MNVRYSIPHDPWQAPRTQSPPPAYPPPAYPPVAYPPVVTRPAPPRHVTVAAWFVVAGGGSVLVDAAYAVVRYAAFPLGSVLWGILACAVLCGLAAAVRRGSVVARVALTVLGVGWLVTLPFHSGGWTASVVGAPLTASLVVAGLALLYGPGSSPWFAGPAPQGAGRVPEVRAVRVAGWTVLGVVLGLGIPGALACAFVIAWGASDGCTGGSRNPACGTARLLLEAGAPAIATAVGALITVVGLVLSGRRPAAAGRVVLAGLLSWWAVGIGLWILAQHL